MEESDSNSMELVWPPSDCSEDECFVKKEDIDRSVTERMIMDQFRDPLVSSESEQESRPNCIDWDKIFKMRAPHSRKKTYVPGHQPPPRFPRLSELTSKQHNQFLRVISKEYPNVLGAVILGKPSHQDVQAFEAAKPIYLREQGRFLKWAKTLWSSVHCQRALRPKPIVESVYEAEFNMKALRMSAFPKYYKVAVHMPLRNPMNNNCDAVIKQDLITVPLEEMADVEIPYNITKPLFAMKPYMSPQPCPNHPYQIILPNEHVLSMLPITDIHRKLATFALNNETTCIASENALKCLTQWNRHWLLPISVCETLGSDGNKVNVLVLDSEFSVHKEVAPVRTYKAFRHLLEQAVIPWREREKIKDIRSIKACAALEEKQQEMLLHASPALNVSAEPSPQAVVQDVDESSDEDHLFIMETGEDIELPKRDLDSQKPVNFSASIEEFDSPEVTCSEPTVSIETDNEVYKCTCEDRFEQHPPRSYRKWSFMKEDTNEKFDIIIHCPHKAKSTNQEPQRDDQDEAGPSTSGAPTSTACTSAACTSTACTSAACTSTACTSTASTSTASTSTACTSAATTSTKWPSTASTSTGSTSTASVSYNLEVRDKPEELLLEPVPEYQLELAASEPSPDAVRGVGLSLALRKNVSVLNVRIHGLSGEVVTVDKLTSEEFTQKHPDVKQEVTNTIYTVVNQLQDLSPGHYVLQHEPCHGSNFVLMRPCSPSDEHTLTLNFDSSKLIKMDEAQFAKSPPTLTTALLPIHKQRRMLPCAFTPHPSLLAKSVKKAPPKKKAPPQALRFFNRNMHKKTIKRNKRNKPSTASNEPSGSREHE